MYEYIRVKPIGQHSSGTSLIYYYEFRYILANETEKRKRKEEEKTTQLVRFLGGLDVIKLL